MNYPVWQLDFAGGGLLIAVVAVAHVYIAHFAVGGGLFLVLTERKGLLEKSPDIIEYTRKHTRFFLLLTLVLGNLTGVGIWFTIGLLNPAATSRLIHLFVFAWAVEWVLFTVEIASLLIYYYTFNRIEEKKHLTIGWIYFLSAWGSLFVINGIIDFMLTPGQWLATGDFWSAFFNPSFWPSLFFRTFLALMIAGLFGLFTSTFLKDRDFRHKMIRYCAGWLVIPLVLLIVSALWYKDALPAHVRQAIFREMPELTPYITLFSRILPLIFLAAVIAAFKAPGYLGRVAATVLLIAGLAYIGSFEFIREGGRRPYIIYDYMYSNSILEEDIDKVRMKGFLKEAKWTGVKEVTGQNRLRAGAELFNHLCLPCHSMGGPLNDIIPLTEGFTQLRMETMLAGMGRINTYMPPFAGNRQEREALAAYIVGSLHDGEDRRKMVRIVEQKDKIPTFDSEKDDYVLLAWNKTGIHYVSDSSAYWLISPPGNTLYAQLIKRGPLPEVISRGVTIRYKVEEGFSNPSRHMDFWDHSRDLFRKNVELNKGLTGNSLAGEMKVDDSLTFKAEDIPAAPYPESGSYQPYPRFEITAVSKKTGEVLARTGVVAPVTTETGCGNCHGKSQKDNRPGISKETAEDVLAVHDVMSHTSLLEKVRDGQPVLCRGCHADKSSGESGLLNLSAAIHGFHANYLSGYGAEACDFCHASSTRGATRFFRGIHKSLLLSCVECHGTIEEFALSLLKAERERGAKGASRLMKNLRSDSMETEEIKPRAPWVNQPGCLNCHVNFQPPRSFSTFNEWTEGKEYLYRNRFDHSGKLRCAACHGSPHALYPARNPYSPDRDVMQPLQYQNSRLPIGAERRCAVCHTMAMDYEGHHPNTLRMFRNK